MNRQKHVASLRVGDTFGDSTPALKYNLDDHLGSSNVLVDEYGTLVNFEEYYPFGETSFGSYAKKRYRFCGKEKDDESGMYYYGARYYSPWLCRFISVDPLAGKYVFQSPYVYADDNPINKMDYNGEGTEGAPSGQSSGNSNQGASLPKPDFSKYVHATKQLPFAPASSTNVATSTPPSTEQLNSLTPTTKIKPPSLNINTHKAVSTAVAKPAALTTANNNNTQPANNNGLPKFGGDYASTAHNFATAGIDAAKGKIHLGSDSRLYSFGKGAAPLSFKNDLGYSVTLLKDRPGFTNPAITFKGTQLNQINEGFKAFGRKLDYINFGIDGVNILKGSKGAWGDFATDVIGFGVQRLSPLTGGFIGFMQVIEPDEISKAASLNDLSSRRNNSFSAYQDWQKGLDASRNFKPPQLFLKAKN